MQIVRVSDLLKVIVMKNYSASPGGMDQELAVLRSEIDTLDREIIRILAERRDLAIRAAKLKIDSKSDLWVADRVREIVETRVGWAKSKKLDTEFVEKLFRDLIDSNMKFEEEMLQDRHK